MDENNQTETPVVPVATNEAPASAPSQTEDHVAAEVKKIESKPKRNRIETLRYNRDRLDKELADEMDKQGIQDEDSRPLTVGEFKQLRQQEAIETARTLADSIADENERKLTIHHLENTIRPTGDPQTDLALARSLVNAVKNGQLAEESARVVRPRSAVSAPSAPPKQKQNDELTKEELDFQKWTKMSKEQIIAARTQA